MTNIKFITNLWREGTMLIPSSENSKHPVSDTQIDTKAMFWQASSKTSPALLPQNLESAQEIDFIALLGHNIEASGITIKFEGADDDIFTGEDLESRTLSYNAEDIFAFVTPFTKQYVRVNLAKTGDFTNYPQIATIVCGKFFEPNVNFRWGYGKGPKDFSEFDYSDSLNLFSQEKSKLDTWSFSFLGLNDVSVEEIIEFLEYHKTIKAFIVIFDSDNPNTDSHWVRFDNISIPRHEGIDYWTWDVDLIEVL